MRNYNLIKNRLVDDESIILFDARISLIKNKSLSEFYSTIRKSKKIYHIRDVEKFESIQKPEAWIVWGTNDTAVYNYLLLSDTGRSVIGCVGEKTIYSQKWCVPLITEVEAKSLVNSRGGMLASHNDKPELAQFSQTSILYVENHLVGRCGWQYFDYFEAHEKESFFDGGSLDGRTSLEFIKWCNGDYSAIYAVEPNPLVLGRLKEQAAALEGTINIYNYALWEHSCKKAFRASADSPWDAQISPNGVFEVQCETVDNILAGREITFIKLDIEGAETEALKGAEQCIKKYKPRLAVSIYHNPYDVVNIITILMSMVPEYNFAIRHYHSDLIETVLYAFV